MIIEIKNEAVDEEIIIKIIPIHTSFATEEAEKFVNTLYDNISGELYSKILAMMLNKELKEGSVIKIRGL